MHSFLKTFVVFAAFLLIISCEKQEEFLEESAPLEVSNLTIKSNNGVCPDILGNSNGIRFIGERRTYTVNANFPVRWSIKSGIGIQIVGSTTKKNVTIQFNRGFRGGKINVFVDYPGFQTDCDVGLEIKSVGGRVIVADCSKPPVPHSIDSEFGTPVPSGYVKDNLGGNYICTTTINNRLSVPFDSCVNYSWSISPSGTHVAAIYPSANDAIVSIKKPGRYKVILVTSNDAGKRIEQFVLNAQGCNSLGGSGPSFL